MTKEQYLFLLRAELDGYLSPEELEDILRYYSEYFEEAGQEQERNVMIELGSPQRLAERILEQRRAEDGLLGEPEPYIPNDGYGYYNEDNGRIPGWVMAILLGVAGLLIRPWRDRMYARWCDSGGSGKLQFRPGGKALCGGRRTDRLCGGTAAVCSGGGYMEADSAGCTVLPEQDKGRWCSLP